MKFIARILILTLMFSCSSSKSGVSKPSKKTLKGTWEVVNIKFVGDKGLYKAFLFDLADSACFKNSEWVFIPNNGSGKFTTSATTSQCEVMTNNIHWSFFDSGSDSQQFQFKYLDADTKAKKVTTGYRGNIDSLTENTMIMRVESTYEGNTFDVLLTYSKVSDDITL